MTLSLGEGAILGLVGPNGAGKTTLLRAIAGIYHPDEGSVTLTGRVAPVLSITASARAGLSAWENIELTGTLMGWTRREARRLAPEVVEMAGLGRFADAPLRVYSAGMRARLGFSLATFLDHEILLLDEVFAVGDEEFRRRGMERLERLVRDGRSVVMSGHDLGRLEDLCERAIRLDGGRVVAEGPADEVIAAYREDMARRASEG